MTAIEWTDATWNPTTGCDRVSPGCANCYALTLAARLKGMGQAAYQNDGDPKTSGPGFALTLHPDRLDVPLRWRKPRMVFVNSMSDLFHEDVPRDFLDRAFAVMALAPQHTFQVLTKRPDRMHAYFTTGAPWRRISGRMFEVDQYSGRAAEVYRGDGVPLTNVWLGTSIENARFTYRADMLRETPAAVRFISAEPLLGSLYPAKKTWRCSQCGKVSHTGEMKTEDDYRHEWHRQEFDLTDIDWLITGGESGHGARAMNAAWVKELRDACQANGTAFFFKQWGGRTPKSGGRILDGREWSEYPAVAA